MLFDEEQDVLLSGNTSGEVQVRRLGTSEMLNSWVAHKRESSLCSLPSLDPSLPSLSLSLVLPALLERSASWLAC
jgi:hypothetical protein